MSRLVIFLLSRLVELQARRPALVLLAALCTAIPAVVLARGLELRTGFGELLPDDSPSVVELRRTNDRLASQSTLAVTAESKDVTLLKRFVDETAPKLKSLRHVAGVDEGTREVEGFFRTHKHLYADIADIRSVHQTVTERYDWEVSRQLGTNLDDEEPPRIDSEALARRFENKIRAAEEKTPGKDGYFIGEDGTFAVILVRTSLGAMDQRAFELKKDIERFILAAGYDRADPSFRYGFTGNLVTSAEQYREVTADLTSIGAAGVAFVLVIVYLFFFRVRAVLTMGLCIVLGCLWCFAFAEATIGHLNTATGFLISVVAGNGINAMVIYMARYLEARRDQGMSLAGSLRTATLETWSATLAAAGVATVAYGALMTTEFRGFRHFGVIGAAGMLLCWLSTYLVLPSALAVAERLAPFRPEQGWRERLGGNYGRPFVWLARRTPRLLVAIGLATAAGSAWCTHVYFAGDPMEYDLHNIRNDHASPTSAGKLASRVNKVTGLLNQHGRAVLTERVDQVPPLVAELERRRDAAPVGAKPFGQVVSVYSLLPDQQEEKIALLREIVDRLDRARRRDLLSDEEWTKLAPHLPREIGSIGIDALPEQVVRPFVEKDGTRGRIVYVAPAQGRSLYDARYLQVWANSFREVRLPSGEVVRGTGDAVVFSDMLDAIARDAPRVALISFAGSMLVVIVAFRGRRSGWAVLATLALGVGWLVSVLHLSGVKLNFLNFVAIPIAIGVGADYAINVMKRRELEGDAGIERAFVETGGAVVACSMTTLSGYMALLLSSNGAVRSLGFAAAMGEAATQLSAMLVLPGCLYCIAEWRSRKGGRAS